MSVLHLRIIPVVAATAMLAAPAFAQGYRQQYQQPYQQQYQQQGEGDAELRIQQLENQIRQLTGQNEELQYRNRQLEERLRAAQGGQIAPGGQANAAPVPNAAPQPGVAASPPPRQAPPVYDQQAAAPAPIVQDPAAPAATGRRRGDAFDPNANPNAPGAPRALGGGQMPISRDGSGASVGAPAGRNPGEALDLANTSPRTPNSPAPAQGGLTTLPPGATPRDEYDLGIGYMQRKDYALAEETMRNFAQKYPSDPLLPDSQYWLGESLYQRQKYREAAETFLGVTTKYDTTGKAPDALLRLGQSLAALNEKEAACAALGEVTRKYPRASNGVKQSVDREQKRVKC